LAKFIGDILKYSNLFFSSHPELVGGNDCCLQLESLTEWIESNAFGSLEDVFKYIRIGEFGIVSIEKVMGTILLIHAYVDDDVSSEWIYKDWIYFCSEMRGVGVPIGEGCLDFSSGVDGVMIYYNHRILGGR